MFKRILVPIDGSETAGRALAAAIDMARESGGSVRLVHQVEDLSHLSALDPSGGGSGELFKVMREAARSLLAESTERARAAGVEADSAMMDSMSGRLGEAVAEAARAWNADLVVVGTHGRRGLARAVLGSGAEQIIRTAATPVLVVRDPAAAQAVPA